MRQGGQLVGLSFSDYAFNVVVVHFEYDLQDRGALISYRIRTEIVPDNLTQADDTSGAIAAALANDVASAALALTGFGPLGAQGALASTATSLAAAGEPNSAIRLAAIGVGLQAGSYAIQGSIASAARILPGTAGSAAPGFVSATGLGTAVAAAGALAGAVQAAAYVNRSNNRLRQLEGQPQGVPLISA